MVPTSRSPPCWKRGYRSAICIHGWFEMDCHFSPSLIPLGVRHESGKLFHAVPQFQGGEGVTTIATTVSNVRGLH